MSTRETFTFEHRGCMLTVVATKLDAEWRCDFKLTFPMNTEEPPLWVREAPFPSAEEAFENAKRWAVREIERRMA
jgi:hypothetical protein